MKVHIYETKEKIIDVPEGMSYITVDRPDAPPYFSVTYTHKQLPIETLRYETPDNAVARELAESRWERVHWGYNEIGEYRHRLEKQAVFDESTLKAFQFLEEKYKSEVESVKLQLQTTETRLVEASFKLGWIKEDEKRLKERWNKINNMSYLKRIWHFLKGGRA